MIQAISSFAISAKNTAAHLVQAHLPWIKRAAAITAVGGLIFAAHSAGWLDREACREQTTDLFEKEWVCESTHLGNVFNVAADYLKMGIGTALFLARTTVQVGWMWASSYALLPYLGVRESTARDSLAGIIGAQALSLYSPEWFSGLQVGMNCGIALLAAACYKSWREDLATASERTEYRESPLWVRVATPLWRGRDFRRYPNLKILSFLVPGWFLNIYSLNLTHNPQLELLRLKTNNPVQPPILWSLDLSQNTLLRELYLNSVNCNPFDLNHNTALEILDLSSSAFLGLPNLSQNTALKVVNLSNCSRFELPELSNHPALQTLDLSHNYISTLPDSILRLSRHCEVYVWKNRFTQEYIDDFQQRLQHHRQAHLTEGPQVIFENPDPPAA